MSALVLPGDRLPLSSAAHVKLGPGLVHASASASASASAASSSASTATVLHITRAGLLARTQAGKGAQGRWVETNARRYIPSPGDSIVGQVTHRSADGYLLSLGSGCAHSATLPALAFEGATKRQRPNLRVGALVYARIAAAERHAEPEATCVDAETGKAEGFGELKVDEEACSMCFKTTLGLARSLLRPSHPLLPALATHFPFEAAVGHNGLIWARAGEHRHLIAFGAVLRAADEHVPSASSAAAASGSSKKKKTQQQQLLLEEGATHGMDGATLAEKRGALSEAEVRRIVAMYT